MFEKLKALWNKPVPIPPEPPKTEAKKERKKKEEQLSPKEIATNNNEPYVAITSVEVDPSNINSGSFELDFNDKFVINLIKAGYKLRETDTDVDIVDRWFQTVCRNIALEVYEQQDADPKNREADLRVVRSRDIGNGRSEIS
jgi:hypothetical protein